MNKAIRADNARFTVKKAPSFHGTSTEGLEHSIVEKAVSSTVGKKKWHWVPEFDRQFHDGRSHITCPKCSASLGDAWEEKGGRIWSPVGAFEHQYWGDRRHLTCPRCSLLLGEAYWLHPTVWDRITYIFSERSGVMGMLIASFIIVMVPAMLAVVAFTYTGVTPISVVLNDFIFLCCLVLPLWIGAFLALGGHYNAADDDDDWWWFYS